MHSGRLVVRLALTFAVLPTVFLGVAISPLVQLLVLVAIVAGGAIADTVLTNNAIPRLRGREGWGPET